MFEFLFKYPAAVFSKGEFVLMGGWPVWVLALLIVLAGGLLAWQVRRDSGRLAGLRPAAIWGLQTVMAALILFLLWHPAISVATLRAQQNVVAVLVDDSGSMSTKEAQTTRLKQALDGLSGGVLDALKKRFQVRLYRFGGSAERLDSLERVAGTQPATRIGDALVGVLADTATLPLGAIVVLTDGADNSGGIDRETITQIRQRRIPVHAVGVGRVVISPDVELMDAIVPHRTLADSRATAQVTYRQNGYAGGRANIVVKDGARVLASQPIVFRQEGTPVTQPVSFQVGLAGAKTFQFSIEAQKNEENPKNNAQARLVNVEASKPRILYMEGEPRWEFKFIRRAADEDRNLHLVSIMRTTQNKFYRQGIGTPKELEEGFPVKADALFEYAGLIIGNNEANYFTRAQRDLIREFANRRGGGVLFLGGRATFSDGGYQGSELAEMLPVRLPERRNTFHREQAAFELTPAGMDNLICRLVDDPARNVERWRKMPLLADYQEVGDPKPGAVSLLDLTVAGRRKSPLLVVESYGRGRTAVFATSGSWRWQMAQPLNDLTHETFWQQMMRWLVEETPGRVVSSTPKPVLSDDPKVRLRTEVRDKEYQPVSDARVEASVLGPSGVSQVIELAPQPHEEGVYTVEFTAEKPGAYVAEIVARRNEEELGRDVVQIRREDGVAENFRLAQNRELLEKLAEQTGGAYYRVEDLKRLPEEIAFSEAGITSRETRDLWDMPAVFLAAFALRAVEWILRRKWGVV